MLAAGERLDFRFESSEPVHFDLRYRDAAATVLLMAHDGVREHAAIYPVPVTRPYCLAWEAGAAGAHLDYRFTVQRRDALSDTAAQSFAARATAPPHRDAVSG